MVGVSGAVQTQILGISTGQAYSDENCMRLKNAKVLYDMGMKVAAVALMCQTRSVFDAMKFAGTPCPINSPTTGEGLIGQEATAEWRLNPKKIPKKQQTANMDRGVFLEKLVSGIIGVILLAILVV
jgi:poly(3-hydroxybutyrate) depolymerase